MATGIYTITNTVNGKMYVGFSIDVEKRWKTHIMQLNAKEHNNTRLQRAWNKYGGKSFEFELLVECANKFLRSEENYWCNLLDTHNKIYGYNIQPTSPYGNPLHSLETKQKIAIATIGHTRNLGRVANKERVEKLRKTKQESMGIPIVVLKADNGEFVCEKASKGEVAVFLGLERTKTGNISTVLRSKTARIIKGYTLVYKKDYDPSKNYKVVYLPPNINNSGEKNPRAKVTAEEVKKIRILYKEGKKPREIRAIFPVLTKPGLEGILSRKTWKNVD